MEPGTLLLLVGVLACPIAMGLMMWWMNKNMGSQSGQSMPGQASETERLKALREQRRLLGQEIAEVERIALLEAQKEALAHGRDASADGQPRPVESASH
ncbi:MAG: hypothetical protein ACRDHL_01890 [Candidatus Promineifilaceae bacterium]